MPRRCGANGVPIATVIVHSQVLRFASSREPGCSRYRSGASATDTTSVIAPHRTVAHLAALLVAKRLLVWGTGLLALSWFVYLHTMLVPGITDRVGRVKGADYIQFY